MFETIITIMLLTAVLMLLSVWEMASELWDTYKEKRRILNALDVKIAYYEKLCRCAVSDQQKGYYYGMAETLKAEKNRLNSK